MSDSAFLDLPTVALHGLAAGDADVANPGLPTAAAMAKGALKNSQADLAVAITGIAGPGGGSKRKPVGLVYFALVIARLVWRTSHKPPDLPPDIGEFDRRTSLAAHHLLYVLMVLIPIFGVVAFVWHGRAFDYGSAQLNFGVASNPGVFHPAEEVHQVLAYCLFGLAALHAAAALYHHFVRRDGVLLRILPGGTG